MPVATDRDHIGPVGWFHEDSSDLGAGNVEGGGAVIVRALDAGTAVLGYTLWCVCLCFFIAEHTFL